MKIQLHIIFHGHALIGSNMGIRQPIAAASNLLMTSFSEHIEADTNGIRFPEDIIKFIF